MNESYIICPKCGNKNKSYIKNFCTQCRENLHSSKENLQSALLEKSEKYSNYPKNTTWMPSKVLEKIQIKEITDENVLQKIGDIIKKHCNSHFFYRTNFWDKIAVNKITEGAVLRIFLRTFFVMRHLDVKEVPSTRKKAELISGKASSIDLWAIPLPTSDADPNKEYRIEVPGSWQLKNCICNSAGTPGLKPCIICEGSSEILCDMCDRDGLDVVSTECPNCDGSGSRYSPSGTSSNCPGCDGTGEVKVKKACQSCNGYKKVQCRNCNNGFVLCSSCEGTRKVISFYECVTRFSPVSKLKEISTFSKKDYTNINGENLLDNEIIFNTDQIPISDKRVILERITLLCGQNTEACNALQDLLEESCDSKINDKQDITSIYPVYAELTQQKFDELLKDITKIYRVYLTIEKVTAYRIDYEDQKGNDQVLWVYGDSNLSQEKTKVKFNTPPYSTYKIAGSLIMVGIFFFIIISLLLNSRFSVNEHKPLTSSNQLNEKQPSNSSYSTQTYIAKLFIQKDSVNLRQHPNLSSQIITQLNKGQEVDVIEYSKDTQWAKVFASESSYMKTGYSGWVRKDFLGEQLPSVHNKDKVNLVSNPETIKSPNEPIREESKDSSSDNNNTDRVTSEPIETINEAVNAIANKDWQRLYNTGTGAFKARVAYEPFYNNWKSNISLILKDYRLENYTQTVAKVQVRFVSTDYVDKLHTKVETAEFVGFLILVYEDGKWLLDDPVMATVKKVKQSKNIVSSAKKERQNIENPAPVIPKDAEVE